MSSTVASVRDTEGKETDKNPSPNGDCILVGETENEENN